MSKFKLTGLVLLIERGRSTPPGPIRRRPSCKATAPRPAALRSRSVVAISSLRRHGREWSCSTCHGAVPVQPGKHAATGKTIAPLAPAFDARRFSDAAKVEKWFGRNCNDVLGRPCSATEKADVLAWLISLKP